MAPTDMNNRTNELHSEVNREKRRCLAYIPEGFISRKSAMRDWKLSEKDLSGINQVAVSGARRQAGLFYPTDAVKQVADRKKAESKIDETMIPESVIKSQVSRKMIDYTELRQSGEYGTREGHLGRGTYFYKKEVLENTLDVKIIGPTDVLGVDYLPAKYVPAEVRGSLPSPKLALRGYGDGPFSRAELCYFGVLVLELDLRGVTANSDLKISSRRQLPSTRSESQLGDLGLGEVSDFQAVEDAAHEAVGVMVDLVANLDENQALVEGAEGVVADYFALDSDLSSEHE